MDEHFVWTTAALGRGTRVRTEKQYRVARIVAPLIAVTPVKTGVQTFSEICIQPYKRGAGGNDAKDNSVSDREGERLSGID